MSAHETVSEKWLKSAQSAVNADPSFRKRGSIDVKMAVKSDKSIYLVTFGGFSCHDVRTITDAGVRDADFAIDMSADQWDRFVQGRRNGSGRTLVDLDTTDDIIKAINPRKKLDFLRYHTSLQAFFDAGARAGSSQAA